MDRSQGVEEVLPHKLVLDERRRLTMTGVREVLRFDEEQVLLRTSLGELEVFGSGLKLKTLSLEGGQVAVEGEIRAMEYEQAPRKKRGLW